MSTLEKYQTLKAKRNQIIMAMTCFLILELFFSTIYLKPELFHNTGDYKVSIIMDEAIILSLVIAIIISFSSRKLRKKIEPITVLPIFAWLVFYGIPYCYHMICGLF